VKRRHPALVAAILLSLNGSAFGATPDVLRAGFEAPPHSARPQTWWHWMNGNITKAGITADLEAMKRIGLGGATIVNVDCDIPAGPVKFMSPEWRDCFKFAVQEADRLGLKICVENCAGWSSSGGPWVTPANAMQRLTFSETKVAGGKRFDDTLAKPQTKLDYYQDIVVLAYQPKPSSTIASNSKVELQHAYYQSSVGTQRADVTAKVQDLIDKKTKAVEVKNGTFGTDPAPGEVKEVRLELLLNGQPEVLTIEEGGTLYLPTNARQLAIAKKLERTGASLTFVGAPSPERVAESEPVPLDGILDLTKDMDPDGRLRWDAPAGDWRVLRIGYTPVGVKNHPSPPEGLGLEVDKLSRSALDAHWDGFMKKVLDDVGPLAGKTLDAALIDSYEVGKQDWTANFREEFQKRRGYDPLKYLLTYARVSVDSPDVTERFLWDMRRTAADLFADNYFGHFAELCRKNGLLNATEPYGGPFDAMQSGSTADEIMGEFWAGSSGHPSVKLAASIGHVNGIRIIAAESFTAGRDRWTNDPYALKLVGDRMFCQGLNRYVFHRFAMQPWTNRVPGMTMGKWGFHFDRTTTWWNQGRAWIDYIARCQFLLQQGRAVNDVAYFTGESAPSFMRLNQPPMPAGYDFDAVNSQAILAGASVKQGRITLPSGATYAALVLPPGDSDMTPPMLEKIGQLVRAGATVVGPKPQRSPSLANYPACDEQVSKLANELWGDCDGKSVQENKVGQGRIVWGKPLEDVLASQQLKPDFTFKGVAAGTRLEFGHRVTADEDIYFVSNQRRQFDTADCTFRVAGKVPHLWHADTGVIEPATIWNEQSGRTTVRLSFDPAGSVFVIFRTAARPDNVVAATANVAGDNGTTAVDQPQSWEPMTTHAGRTAVKFWGNGQVNLTLASGKSVRAAVTGMAEPAGIAGPWTVSFPPNLGAPAEIKLDQLISWPDHADIGVRYFSGTATYEKQIDIPADRLAEGRELWLDLGEVKNIAEVSLNGHNLGILWKPPFRADITKAAKVGANQLVVKITNLWPNRLIGDEQLSPDTEWNKDGIKEWPQWLLDGKPSPTGRVTFTTWHHWKADEKLLPSGLIGPVTLRSAAVVEATEQ
jgi:hypothetical protein